MQIENFTDIGQMSEFAAKLILERIRENPGLSFCPATGNSPKLTYRLLADAARQQPDLFYKLKLTQLDEWGGLNAEEEGSCLAYLQKLLIRPLGILKEHLLLFNGKATNPEEEVRRFTNELQRMGGLDLCLLGLGTNGHLGFIEPARELALQVHVANLQTSSQQHAMVKDLKSPPKFGYTLGISDIMKAKQVILMVSGPRKEKALRALLQKRISTEIPASFLFLHPNALCLVDEAIFS